MIHTFGMFASVDVYVGVWIKFLLWLMDELVFGIFSPLMLYHDDDGRV